MTDLFVAGTAALVAAIDRRSDIAALSFTLASILYMRSFWNLNPLLETDWYYVLTDILGRPNLRHDSFEQLFMHQRRSDIAEALYGVGAILYAVVLVVFAIPTFVRESVGAWISPVASPTVVSILPAAAAMVASLSIVSSVMMEHVGVKGHAMTLCKWPRRRIAAKSSPSSYGLVRNLVLNRHERIG